MSPGQKQGSDQLDQPAGVRSNLQPADLGFEFLDLRELLAGRPPALSAIDLRLQTPAAHPLSTHPVALGHDLGGRGRTWGYSAT